MFTNYFYHCIFYFYIYTIQQQCITTFFKQIQSGDFANFDDMIMFRLKNKLPCFMELFRKTTGVSSGKIPCYIKKKKKNSINLCLIRVKF